MMKRLILGMIILSLLMIFAPGTFAESEVRAKVFYTEIKEDVPKIEIGDSTVNIGGGSRDKKFGTVQEDAGGDDYSVKVTKTKSINGELYTITTNVPEQSQIICVCYQWGKICAISVMPKILGQDTYFFLPDQPHQAVEVMIFENFDTLFPVTEPVFVS